MKGKKICFGVLLVFFIMLGSFLNVSSDVSATSVVCPSVFISSGNADFSSCDVSSLDSSSDWYYTFNFQFEDTSSLPNSTSSIVSKRDNCSDIFSYTYFSRSFSLRSLSLLNGFNFYFSDSLRSLNTFNPRCNCLSFGSGFSLVGTISLSISDIPFGSSFNPSGSLSISENGTYDVSQYAEAIVNVPPEVVQGDYHDDLVSINNSILIVAAVGLVIYFFYAIYRMILGGRR